MQPEDGAPKRTAPTAGGAAATLGKLLGGNDEGWITHARDPATRPRDTLSKREHRFNETEPERSRQCYTQRPQIRNYLNTHHLQNKL